MNNTTRTRMYLAQNGGRRLTPRQLRRLAKKFWRNARREVSA